MYIYLLFNTVKIKIFKIIISPAVFYGCETWTLTLREENKLEVFENAMLWRTFGRKMDEIVAGWREVRIEVLHNLYFSPNIIRIIKLRRMR
jgi:hypothetical protein